LDAQSHSNEHAAKRPPGPANGPFGIRHIYRCNTRPLEFYERLGSYGDIATFRIFGVRAFFLNSPDLIHPVLRDTGTRFRKLPRNLKMLSRGLGRGLLSSEGQEWLTGRRLVQPAFNSRAIQATLAAAVPSIESMLARWSRRHRVEIFAELDRLTIEMASRALLGVTLHDEAARLGGAARMLAHGWARSLRQVFPLPHWLPLSRQRSEHEAIAILRGTIGRMTDERAPYVHQEINVLSRLIAAYESAPQEMRLNRERLIDEVLTLFIAAYHASAVTLCWTLYLLARHAKVRERLLDEVDTTLGDRPPTFDDLNQLPLTECVLKESMRLYPSAWEMFPRQAIEVTPLGHWHIPRNAWLFMSPYVTHRDARYFINPLEFDPDRWSPERIDRIDSRAYFPFGGGRHICIGREMAMAQNTLVLVMILQKYRMEFTAREHVPHPLPPMALVPRDPMWVALAPRHASVLAHT
jgi:cytochrome P450